MTACCRQVLQGNYLEEGREAVADEGAGLERSRTLSNAPLIKEKHIGKAAREGMHRSFDGGRRMKLARSHKQTLANVIPHVG